MSPEDILNPDHQQKVLAAVPSSFLVQPASCPLPVLVPPLAHQQAGEIQQRHYQNYPEVYPLV
jgi:hypothetical protein